MDHATIVTEDPSGSTNSASSDRLITLIVMHIQPVRVWILQETGMHCLDNLLNINVTIFLSLNTWLIEYQYRITMNGSNLIWNYFLSFLTSAVDRSKFLIS